MNRLNMRLFAGLAITVSFDVAVAQSVTKDSVLSYDPKVSMKASSNVEMSPEDTSRLAAGVTEQLMSYIPSAAVFDLIGGYLKPDISTTEQDSPDFFIEVPKVRLELLATTSGVTQRVEKDLYVQEHDLGGDQSIERVAEQYGRNSVHFRDFASKCQSTPAPSEIPAHNPKVDYRCVVSLPQINIRQSGNRPVYVERGGGAEILYSGQISSKVTIVSGSSSAILSSIYSTRHDPFGLRSRGARYTCRYSAVLAFDPPVWEKTEIDRCLNAAIDPETTSQPTPDSEGNFQTPVQRVIDRVILGLMKKQATIQHRVSQ
jgi:hypothetical protein